MKMLHNQFSSIQTYSEPLSLGEAVKTYLAILFGVGLSFMALHHLAPIHFF